jgi:tetratricopeptide (TPR) repeat protein
MRRIVPLATALAIAASLLARSAAMPGGIGVQNATREAAYRHNNIGVAYLEQYNFEAAVASFRSALEQDDALGLARLNLGIALFYAGQPDAAAPELERARQALPERPHADYVLGLIARAANRPEEALAAFTRARKLDATDPGISINIGQLHLQQRQYKDALASFRVAEAAEPYNATAAYGLATALIRSGAADDGKAAMARFEKLRESNYATTFSQAYLEQGRYAEAIASTGTEAGLVDERTPEIGFANATADTFAAPATGTGAVTLFDVDADGDLDLAIAGESLRLYRNERGRLTDVTAAAFTAKPSAANGVVAGDADKDGDSDLLVLGAAGAPVLYRQQKPLTFVAAAADTGMPQMQGVRTAAWLDADHDGDLDIALAGFDAGARPASFLLRNNGDGKFTDISAAAGLAASPQTTTHVAVSVVPTDFDNRRDIDILAASAIGGVQLFRNMRDGTFRDVAKEVGLAQTGGAGISAATIADVNKDGYPDMFFGNPSGPGGLAMSDGRGRFVVTAAPAETANARAAQFLDYDNDGLIDLLLLTAQGPRLLRNVGGRWTDVSGRTFKSGAPAAEAYSLASGDLDGDGDTDVVIGGKAGPAVLRNDGGERSRSLAIRLQSRVSNRTAAGAKIEVRAGSLKQRLETSAASPAPVPADIVFGFGSRPGADVVRVLWPSGILQAETAAAGGPTGALKPGDGLSGAVKIEELDRKPSSCPYLFTWNGTRFEFVTDFLGGGEMGYLLAPGVRNVPDPDEYIRIDGRLLQPRNGRYELRVTNELEETVFLDRAELVAIAHPADIEVHPNEGLRSAPAPFTLYAVRDALPPAAAHDDRGRDVLDRLVATDRRYVDGFPLERVRGYAAEHSLTLTLPPSPSDRRVLLLTGWTDYAFSGDNVAASQLGLRMVPPSLQVEGADGTWRTVIAEIGFPVGRPQTVAVDLTGKVPASARRVRIATSMRIYWDRVQVGTLDDPSPVRLTRLEALASELRWRGFSVENPPDGREPLVFDYDRVRPSSPWKVMTGRYTREGDVRELVTRTDDRFVIGRPGDEITLSFDATGLPPLPSGWTRTFLLHADGFSKEMDLSSASPDQVEPLPYHGMKAYPYAPGDAPALHATPAHQAYVSRYLTRIVKRNLPPLELSGR